LAPTVLVSLVLVAACTVGVLYLNYLQVNSSDVVRENEKSTRAAMRLETTTTGLLHLLRDHPQADLTGQLWPQCDDLHTRLRDAEKLANLDRERTLVLQIAQGLDEFEKELARVEPREQPKGFQPRPSPEDFRKLGRLLEARVYQPCLELTKFNSEQIEKSAEENRSIVETLRLGLLAVGLGGPLIGLLLGYAVARGLSRSIYQLRVRMRDAAGRLNRELASVTLEEKGDLPDLHRQMQGMVEEIERVVDQLQQRDREVLRAEQLAAVGQVAAGVAHELRNPLTSVKMLVQTGLEGDQPTGLPAEDLAIIEQEVRRMEQCIQTFIDFARPPRSERTRADLGGVVRRALALVEGRARRQKVTLAADLPPNPVYLEIDADQIHQVVVNLILNALDALPRGGTVAVSLASVARPAATVNGQRSLDQGVEVRIQDTGPGIARGIRERMFEPFVSSKETGLGLGLNICKRLIEVHGGTIRGENAAEGGAVFAFTLPM
jgi:signal transduction histidine kinase